MNPAQHYHSGKHDHTVTVRCLSKKRWMLELNGTLNTAGQSQAAAVCVNTLKWLCSEATVC